MATLAALSLGVTSCGGGGGSTGSAPSVAEVVPTVESGTVTLLATDAETDQFSAINLTITQAELLAADGGSELLFAGSKTFNLLALADVTEVFSITEVPVGDYDKIRLTLTQIELVFHDDRTPVYPSLPGNGKLDINPRGVFRVDAQESLTLELDFDAEKSLQIVSRGNGEFNFRPVVFTKQVENEFDTKLIRQQGIIREFDGTGGDFLLCLPEDDLAQLGDEEDCISVDASAGAASIFGSTGLPAGLESLENGETVTVVGRFFDAEEVMLASASGVIMGALASDGEFEDDESEDDAFEDEELEDDESEDDESEDDASEDDESEDDESEDDESEDDESEDDESEDDESEDDESEDDESEDDESEDDESEDDESEDDESEDDESEDDESEDDEPEDDESEDDESEDDDSEDDVNSGLARVLVADVIWLGDDFSRTENVACTEVAVAGDGLGFDNAELPLAAEEQCSDTARLTLVTPGTRIYDEDGSLLESNEIDAGDINQVDGFITGEGDEQVIRAAMIILSDDDDSEDDQRNQFTGTIGVLEAQSLTLITDDGDLCVVFEDGDTSVFESSDTGGGQMFSEQTLDSLSSGLLIDAFGEINEEGCFEAGTIIFQAGDS